ncbi:MAG TPA: GNAT family N-acetyltransferase [Trebonia sp.]|jgi:GNAT superfamily N-acetyltransferase
MTAASVRPAIVEAAEAVGLVHVRSWRSAYRGKIPQSYLDGLDPAQRAEVWRRAVAEADPAQGGVHVAVTEGGDIVGFAAFGPSRDGDTDPRVTGEVFAIYARPDTWGKGAGRALMESAIAELTRLGYADAILWVLDTNDRARRFYTRAGWAEDGSSKADGSRGSDITEVRYRRTLRPCA